MPKGTYNKDVYLCPACKDGRLHEEDPHELDIDPKLRSFGVTREHFGVDLLLPDGRCFGRVPRWVCGICGAWFARAVSFDGGPDMWAEGRGSQKQIDFTQCRKHERVNLKEDYPPYPQCWESLPHEKWCIPARHKRVEHD